MRKAYACLLIPFCLPYIVTQLLLGGDRVVVALAFMVYIPVVLVIAKRQTDLIERQIRLAIENESLAEELRQERDRANQARLDLEVQLEEQKRSTQRIRELNVELERQAHELRPLMIIGRSEQTECRMNQDSPKRERESYRSR